MLQSLMTLFLQVLISLTLLYTSKTEPTNLTESISLASVHSDLISGVRISEDGATLVTGSFDNKVQIWNLSSGSLTSLQNVTYSDWVTALSINPSNNQILVATYDSIFSVLDPGSYAETRSPNTYPDALGSGSDIQFDSTSSSVYIAGYTSVSSAPKIHKFETSAYSTVLPVTLTAYPNSAEITSMSLIEDQYAAVVDNTASAPFYLRIYDVTSQTMFQQLSPSSDEFTELEYSPLHSTLYAGSKDQTIRTLSVSPINSQYEVTSTTYTNDFGTGIPREMSTEFHDYLFALIDTFLVEYSVDSAGRLSYSQNFSLSAAGQTIDIQYPYVVVGCDGGLLKVFEFQAVPQSEGSSNSLNDLLIIGGVLLGLALVIVLIYFVSSKVCGSPKVTQEQQPSMQKLEKPQRRHETQENISRLQISDMDLEGRT